MNTSDFDAQIVALEASLEAKKLQMEVVTQRFIEVAKPYVLSYSQKVTENIRTANATKIVALGGEKVRELRRRIEQLEVDLPSQVEADLNTDNLWPHRASYAPEAKPSSISGSEVEKWSFPVGTIGVPSHYGPYQVPVIDRRLGRLTNLVSLIFHEYGIHPYTGTELKGWSQEMTQALQDYASLVVETRTAASEIKRIQGEKTTAEANALWGD